MKRPLFIISMVISLILVLTAPFLKKRIDNQSHLSGKTISLNGIVKDIQPRSKNGILSYALYINGQNNVIAYMEGDEHIPRIGSTVCVVGKVITYEHASNDGMFDALTYYATIGISYGLSNAHLKSESTRYSIIGDFLYQIRVHIGAILDSFLPSEESAIMRTMLLGEKSLIDDELKDLYQRNGIAHILSISGLHISLIGWGLYKLLRFLSVPLKPCAIISSITIFLYGLMTGFSVSSSRAILMYSISMLAVVVGRTYDLMTTVSFVMMLILLRNPLYIYHSGFIFSFGYIFGIAIISPTLLSPSMSETRPGPYLTSLLSSLSTTLIGIPIFCYCYYQFPIYAVFLNFLVIPTMSILVPSGIVLVALSFLPFISKTLIQYLIIGILRLYKTLSIFTDSLPFHYYTPGRPYLIQMCLFIIAVTILYFLRTYVPIKKKILLMFILIFIINIRTRPLLEVDMLDVGQGESIFIRGSNAPICIPGLNPESTILIDGGSTTVKDVGKYRIIPFLKYNGVSTLDSIIVTHTDQDHISGIIELISSSLENGIKIRTLMLPRIGSESIDDKYTELLDLASQAHIDTKLIARGDILKGLNYSLSCLSPVSDKNYDVSNEGSAVFLLNGNNIKILFTGDIEGAAEDELADYIKNSGFLAERTNEIRVLKVPHHGSRNSSSENMLSLIKPQLALISAGQNNSYGHPHEETLNRLQDINSTILRTDQSGQIRLLLNKDICDRYHFRYSLYNKPISQSQGFFQKTY